MSALFAASCESCGRRTDDGATYCERCARTHGARSARVPEPVRNARFPYRGSYRDPEYRRNRAKRIAATASTLDGVQKRAGYVARCEQCSIAVKRGEFECHHVTSVREWNESGRTGSPHQYDNLRILCTVAPSRCHHAVKGMGGGL